MDGAILLCSARPLRGKGEEEERGEERESKREEKGEARGEDRGKEESMEPSEGAIIVKYANNAGHGKISHKGTSAPVQYKVVLPS